jgi:prepilin-type N-terminal cleavage/methylation domain-containing protein
MKGGSLWSRGFTLLETVMSLGLVGICLALTLPFLQVQRGLSADRQAFREEHAALAAALRWIARDLQEAGYGCPGPAVVELEEERLTYAVSRSDDDPAGLSPSDRRLISVYLRGDKLMYRIQAWDPEASKWRKGSSHAIARGVVKVRFAGLDASGEATTVEEISSVKVTLAGKRAGSYTTLVTIRNHRGSPVL